MVIHLRRSDDKDSDSWHSTVDPRVFEVDQTISFLEREFARRFPRDERIVLANSLFELVRFGQHLERKLEPWG